MRITINKPALEKLTDYAVAALKRVGDGADAAGRGFTRAGMAADAIGRAAGEVQRAAEAQPRRRGMSAWGASAWSDLLGRFTGR